VKPVSVDHWYLLDSDCKYREDAIIYATGDIERAQKEKERLEEMQRYDRNLREEAKKKRRR
jgi:Oxysterol-binding protein